MDKIEVGEYVRTKDGYIRKVKDIICKGYPIKKLEGYIVLDDEDRTILNPEEIRHSFNIIDLIEERDIVNESLIVYRGKVASGKEKLLVGNHIINGMSLEVASIKTILTHEQYEKYSYKLN